MADLPHNLEAEMALLGALIDDNSLLERICALEPADFYDPVLGRVFDAVKSLSKAGIVADGLRLRERFKDDAGIVELGGAGPFLMRLMNAAPLTYQALEYARLIRHHAQCRAIFSVCRAAANEIVKPDADPVEVARAAERQLQALALGTRAWTTLREAGEGVVSMLREPAPRGLRSGLAKVDELLSGGFYAPDLVIIAGRPAMGKTALADVLAVNVAAADKVVGFFSMEMDPEQVAARVLARRAANDRAFSYSQLREPGNRPDPDYVASLVPRLPDTLLIDPTGAQTLAAVDAQARAMRTQMGRLDMILVDYLQLMRDPAARRENRTQEISEITMGLKAMAKRLKCPVIALSQLSRALENRADKTPQLSDLRESGSIEQDADVVLFVYREHYYLERSVPTPEEGEDRSAFSSRLARHKERMKDVEHKFKLVVGKNRHGSGGQHELYCDLSRDIISDEPPGRTPSRLYSVHDGPL